MHFCRQVISTELSLPPYGEDWRLSAHGFRVSEAQCRPNTSRAGGLGLSWRGLKEGWRAGVVGVNDISHTNAFRCGAMSILWFSDTFRLSTDMVSISLQALLRHP